MSAQQWELDEAREVIAQRNAEILRQNAELRGAAAEIRSLREALANGPNQIQLDTAMALLREFHETCVTVITREGWQSGPNRDAMIACGRKYWQLRKALNSL